MDEYDVELLPAAYTDLDEIFDYIMVNNPQAAARMLDNIMRALSRLETFPYSGALLPDASLETFDFRVIIVEPYLVFYRFVNNKVYVYRVLHGARNYLHLLLDEQM